MLFGHLGGLNFTNLGTCGHSLNGIKTVWHKYIIRPSSNDRFGIKRKNKKVEIRKYDVRIFPPSDLYSLSRILL